MRPTQKDESQGVGALAFKQNKSERTLEFAKQFATLQAQLARRGWIVSVEAGGYFNVSRWGHVRTFDSLEEVDRFADQVGVST